MKQRTLYQVRVTQEIPFCDYDEDGEETQVSSGRIEEYVAGRFSAEHNAKLFAEALENKIAEGSGRNRLFYCIGVHTARKGFAVFYYVGQLHGCYWVDILKERKTEHDKFRSVFVDCGFIDTHRRRSNFIPGTGRVSHYLFNGCK